MKQKKNLLIFFIGIIAFIACFIICYHSININKGAKFKRNLCVKGHCNTWINACICDDPFIYSGKYCNEKYSKNCADNDDCPNGHYCLTENGKGSCYKAKKRREAIINNISYILSDSLISYNSAKNYCMAIGKGYIPVSRSNFNCDNYGAVCLDRDILIALREKIGNIGFFWLDERDDDNAYYADLNDGTVYYTEKENIKYNQVLCIKGKNE